MILIYFIQNFFNIILIKVKTIKKKSNNKISSKNLFTDLEDELIKKFNIYKNNKKISPLKKFNEMLKKI